RFGDRLDCLVSRAFHGPDERGRAVVRGDGGGGAGAGRAGHRGTAAAAGPDRGRGGIGRDRAGVVDPVAGRDRTQFGHPRRADRRRCVRVAVHRPAAAGVGERGLAVVPVRVGRGGVGGERGIGRRAFVAAAASDGDRDDYVGGAGVGRDLALFVL